MKRSPLLCMLDIVYNDCYIYIVCTIVNIHTPKIELNPTFRWRDSTKLSSNLRDPRLHYKTKSHLSKLSLPRSSSHNVNLKLQRIRRTGWLTSWFSWRCVCVCVYMPLFFYKFRDGICSDIVTRVNHFWISKGQVRIVWTTAKTVRGEASVF